MMSNKISYKDSNVQWIGKIPENWKVKPALSLFSENRKKNKNLKVDKVLSLSFGKIVERDVESNFGLLPASFENYQVVNSGDIVLRLTDLQNDKKSLRVGLVSDTGIITSAYVGLVPNLHVNSKYYFYLIHAYDLLKVFYGFGSGVRQTMSFFDLKWLPLLDIPIEEQQKIVNFLDYKTELIDTLIEKNNRYIDLLEEKREAVINQAVTKGLDQKDKMKDSGIEWIDKIPRNWDLIRMKYLADIDTGSRNTEDSMDEGDYPFFVRSQTVERINSYSYDGEAILTAGDGAGVCKVFHYVSKGKFEAHQRVYVINNFRNILGEYLFFYIKYNFVKEVKKLSAKSTVDSLRRPMFQNFPVCVPSVVEQRDIVATIKSVDKVTSQITQKITKQNQLLREYRQALIFNAVTGKIKLQDEKFNQKILIN